jgi:hypothetical protein
MICLDQNCGRLIVLRGAATRVERALLSRIALVGLLAVLAACDGSAHASGAARPPFVGDDLRQYYPNLARSQTQYLEGDDSVPTPPRVSVVWFESKDQSTFLRYNTDPRSAQARCSYDELAWSTDGYLRYMRTVTDCARPRTEIVYEVPIVYLPQHWDGHPWRDDGQSVARYSIDGRLRCIGITAWTAQVLGVEQVAPGDAQLHWRTTQSTTWVTGDVQGGCTAGGVLHWQEDYWLTGHLPDGTRRSNGLRRTAGGNQDDRADTWDVRMTRWTPLPSRIGSPGP